MLLAQFMLDGVILGSVYVLFVLGLTLVLGIFRILNVAHGDVFTWGTLAGYFVVVAAKLPLVPALFAGTLVSGLASVAIYWVAYRPLEGRQKGWELSTLIASLGVSFVLVAAAQAATNTQYLSFPDTVGALPPVTIGTLSVTGIQALMFVISTVLSGLLGLALTRTHWGRQVRTVAFNREVAELMGINIAWISTSVFLIGGLMAGAAGVLTGIAFSSVTFLLGQSFLLKGVAILVLGGFGSFTGAILGGLVIGITESLSVGYISSAMKDVIVFGVLLLFLTVRGGGLVRTETTLRV